MRFWAKIFHYPSSRSDCSSKPNRFSFRKRCHTYTWCTTQRGLLDRFLLSSPFLASETVRCRANVVCAPPFVRVSVSLREPETEPALVVSYLIIRSPIKATMSCPKLINRRCGCIDIDAWAIPCNPSVLLSLDKNRRNECAVNIIIGRWRIGFSVERVKFLFSKRFRPIFIQSVTWIVKCHTRTKIAKKCTKDQFIYIRRLSMLANGSQNFSTDCSQTMFIGVAEGARPAR